jgi:hypothetical protein
LSLYVTLLHHGLNPGLGFTALATLGAIALCAWRLPSSAFGFCLSAAIVEAVFNLTGKEPYFNEWELATGLVLLAIAFGQTGRIQDEPEVARHQVVQSNKVKSPRSQPDVMAPEAPYFADDGGPGSHTMPVSASPGDGSVDLSEDGRRRLGQ